MTLATVTTPAGGTIRGTIIVRGTIRGTTVLAHRPPKIRIPMQQGTIIAPGDDISVVPTPRTGKKKTNGGRVTRIYRPHRPPVGQLGRSGESADRLANPPVLHPRRVYRPRGGRPARNARSSAAGRPAAR